MPKLQDPAICTPERARAVSALHWLGVVQLLFAVGFVVFYTVNLLLREYNPNIVGVGPYFIFYEFFGILLIAFFPAVLGVLAVAEAVSVCRRQRSRLGLGNPSVIGSMFMFPICWLFFISAIFGDIIWNSSFSLSLSYYLFAAYLCIGTVLAMMATHRCNRLRAQEAVHKQ